MSQRMSVAVIVVLLAAASMQQVKTPEFAAVVGTYVAVASTEDGTKEVTLTLREDATLEMRTVSPTIQGEPKVETGGWLLDGSRVQIALSGGAEDGEASGVALERRDDALVGPIADSNTSRFAGLTFERQGSSDPEPNPNT